jgi:hypothetical protein
MPNSFTSILQLIAHIFQLGELEARVQEAEARADRAEDKVRTHTDAYVRIRWQIYCTGADRAEDKVRTLK